MILLIIHAISHKGSERAMVGAMDPATQNNVYSEFEANRKRMFLKIQFTSTRDELDNVRVFFKENSHFLMLFIDFQIYSQCQLPVRKYQRYC